MRRARPILMICGVLATLMGLLWIGQGLGYVDWPSWSTMLDKSVWADRGAVLAVAGLVAILIARRLR